MKPIAALRPWTVKIEDDLVCIRDSYGRMVGDQDYDATEHWIVNLLKRIVTAHNAALEQFSAKAPAGDELKKIRELVWSLTAPPVFNSFSVKQTIGNILNLLSDLRQAPDSESQKKVDFGGLCKKHKRDQPWTCPFCGSKDITPLPSHGSQCRNCNVRHSDLWWGRLPIKSTYTLDLEIQRDALSSKIRELRGTLESQKKDTGRARQAIMSALRVYNSNRLTNGGTDSWTVATVQPLLCYMGWEGRTQDLSDLLNNAAIDATLPALTEPKFVWDEAGVRHEVKE
jgi:hypothetical protein